MQDRREAGCETIGSASENVMTRDSHGSRRRDVLVSLLIGVSVMSVYLRGHMGCSDSRWSIFAAVSLIDSHDLTLDEFEPTLRERGFYFTEHVGAHYYNLYPIGASVLAVPAVVALRPLAAAAFKLWPELRSSLQASQWQRGCPPAHGEVLLVLHSWTEQIVASGLVALTVVLVYALGRSELSTARAILLAAVFAFGTSAWSTASRSLWQHGPSMVMLALTLLTVQRGRHLVLAGAALAFAYVVRPTNAVPLAVLSVWVAVNHPRRSGQYLLGVATVLAPFFLINRSTFGAWLPTYYHPSYFHGNPFFGEALAGLLVSPSRGLFVYSPVLALSFLGLTLKIRQRRLTTFDLALLTCVALHWISTAWVNPDWWGGDSYGPRFFADTLPIWMYWIIPVLGWFAPPVEWRRQAAAVTFAVSSAISVLMHAQGVFNPKAMSWNYEPTTLNLDPSRLWSWRHPPFLAGLIAAPPADRERPPDAMPCSSPPSAPSGLTVVANRDNSVTASWAPSSGPVGRYLVESGNRPGLSDLPTRETEATTITVIRIPPGTYYARVRARNGCGVSDPSNEIVLTVE